MTPDLAGLVMMRDVDARRFVANQMLRFSVLAPVGAYVGCGALRVLRLRALPVAGGEEIEMICGYESYQRWEH